MKNRSLSISIIIACLSFCLLTSCDPGQGLRIENQTDAPATIQFKFKKEKAHYIFEDLRKEDNLTITLGPDQQNATKEFHFGIGHWKVQGTLDSLVAMVESIEIKTVHATHTYKGQAQLQAFFEQRITGSYDEIIEIIVE